MAGSKTMDASAGFLTSHATATSGLKLVTYAADVTETSSGVFNVTDTSPSSMETGAALGVVLTGAAIAVPVVGSQGGLTVVSRDQAAAGTTAGTGVAIAGGAGDLVWGTAPLAPNVGDTAVDAALVNTMDITYDNTAAGPATVKSWALWNGTDLIWYENLAAPKTVGAGDTLRIKAYKLVITES
jgi:hypothetical protein